MMNNYKIQHVTTVTVDRTLTQAACVPCSVLSEKSMLKLRHASRVSLRSIRST